MTTKNADCNIQEAAEGAHKPGEKRVGFVNGKELKKGDRIEYQIKRLAGNNCDPPIIHRGTVVNPNIPYKYGWGVQIVADSKNDLLPDWDLNVGVQAIYGDAIINIL